MVVVGVAVGVWAPALEVRGIIHGPVGGLARFGGAVGVAATVLVGVEGKASGFASDHAAVGVQFEGVGAIVVEVVGAGGLLAAVFAAVAFSVHGLELEVKIEIK